LGAPVGVGDQKVGNNLKTKVGTKGRACQSASKGGES